MRTGRLNAHGSGLWLTGIGTWLVATMTIATRVDQSSIVWAALALSPFALHFLVTRSWMRVVVMVGGGMLVLGSSSDVGPMKVVYAAAMLGCVAVSAYRLIQDPPPWGRSFAALLGWGGVLLACLLLGTVATPGQDVLTVVRQAMFYAMIPLAPIVGLDAGRDMKSRTVMRWIGIISCVAAVGFAADWLNRRGVSSLGFGRFVLSSPLLAAFGFSLALVMVVYARGFARILWLTPVVVIPAALLVTGTRTNLIVFLAILGVLGSTNRYRVPPLKALIVASGMTVAVIVVLPMVAANVISQPGFLEARVAALMNVVTGTSADQSYEARNEQYYYAAKWIAEAPMFGKGPGFSPTISLDTPLATVVRIGIVGSIALVGFIICIYLAAHLAGKQYGFSVIHTAGWGFGVVCCALLPFGTPFEDKGFAFILVLLTMGLSAHLQERAAGAPEPFDVIVAQRRRLNRVGLPAAQSKEYITS